MTSYDEGQRIAAAMIKHGGSFVKSLGRALCVADPINVQRIKDAFPEYWETYKKFAEDHEHQTT